MVDGTFSLLAVPAAVGELLFEELVDDVFGLVVVDVEVGEECEVHAGDAEVEVFPGFRGYFAVEDLCCGVVACGGVSWDSHVAEEE